jgi:hypothetical protein
MNSNEFRCGLNGEWIRHEMAYFVWPTGQTKDHPVTRITCRRCAEFLIERQGMQAEAFVNSECSTG